MKNEKKYFFANSNTDNYVIRKYFLSESNENCEFDSCIADISWNCESKKSLSLSIVGFGQKRSQTDKHKNM